MHLFDAATRFYGGNAIVGGGLPLAVGLALADKLQRRERVTACFFGDGAVAEGEFHESMNLAALWQLPVLFCCENNLYAMGTALERSESETASVAEGGELRDARVAVDGMDVVAVEEAARRAAAAVRGGAARASWSCAPTASARTRCTTRICTATRPRSSNGRSTTRSPRSRRAPEARHAQRRRSGRRWSRGRQAEDATHASRPFAGGRATDWEPVEPTSTSASCYARATGSAT